MIDYAGEYVQLDQIARNYQESLKQLIPNQRSMTHRSSLQVEPEENPCHRRSKLGALSGSEGSLSIGTRRRGDGAEKLTKVS